jgi:hypothetical protein
MDQTITLAELNQEKLDADEAYAAAKRRALDDPKAERELAKFRDAAQLAQDRIDGFNIRQREEAEAAAEKAKAAAVLARREEGNAALKAADERDAIVTELDQAIGRIGELRDALSACDRRLTRHFVDALKADYDPAEYVRLSGALSEQLSSTFQSTDELIAAELITRSGVPFPNVDLFDAGKPLVAGGFLARTVGRTGAVRQLIVRELIAEILAPEMSHVR